MVTLDLRKLQQRLEKQNPSPLYVLCGDESFLVEESLNFDQMQYNDAVLSTCIVPGLYIKVPCYICIYVNFFIA